MTRYYLMDSKNGQHIFPRPISHRKHKILTIAQLVILVIEGLAISGLAIYISTH